GTCDRCPGLPDAGQRVQQLTQLLADAPAQRPRADRVHAELGEDPGDVEPFSARGGPHLAHPVLAVHPHLVDEIGEVQSRVRGEREDHDRASAEIRGGAGPADPVGPGASADPGNPTGPGDPTDPGAAVGPGVPAGPASVGPDRPASPVGPASVARVRPSSPAPWQPAHIPSEEGSTGGAGIIPRRATIESRRVSSTIDPPSASPPPITTGSEPTL